MKSIPYAYFHNRFSVCMRFFYLFLLFFILCVIGSLREIRMHALESEPNREMREWIMCLYVRSIHTDTTYHILTNFFVNFSRLSFVWMLIQSLWLLFLLSRTLFLSLFCTHRPDLIWPQCVPLQIENAKRNVKSLNECAWESRSQRERDEKSEIRIHTYASCFCSCVLQFNEHLAKLLSPLALSLFLYHANPFFDQAKNARQSLCISLTRSLLLFLAFQN